MAYTIAQLQAFSNTKPELRYLTEQIIDYLEANHGGSGSSTYLVYTALLNQTGDDAPVATEYANTIGAGLWTRFTNGDYACQTTTPFDNTKIWMGGWVANQDVGVIDSVFNLPFFDNNGTLTAMIKMKFEDNGGNIQMFFQIKDGSGVATDISDLGTSNCFGLPEIRVYP